MSMIWKFRLVYKKTFKVEPISLTDKCFDLLTFVIVIDLLYQ